MIVGFTGTRHGMTEQQKWILKGIAVFIEEFHVGDCVGADEEAHRIVKDYGRAKTIGHPPEVGTLRAFCEYDEEREPKPYLTRNRDIIREGKHLLIAAPGEKNEVQRSGTWLTVRYARNRMRNHIIIYPDGEVEVFRYG